MQTPDAQAEEDQLLQDFRHLTLAEREAVCTVAHQLAMLRSDDELPAGVVMLARR